MKTKQTLTGAAAVAAFAVAFWNHRTRVIRTREAAFDGKCLREAIEKLEDEGGLVLS